MLGHLRIAALLLHAQRSSGHNCRIGGLMFDNQHTFQTVFYRDLANEILQLFKHLSSEKRLM